MQFDHRDVFVRTVPQKISITETYTYNVQVQKFVNFRFEEAHGEIKLEYLYDGAQRDFRWKLRSIFDGLDRSIIIKDFKHFWGWLFNLRWLEAITRWLGLRYLARLVRKLVLGPWQDDKYFGAAALSDALNWGKEYPKVGAGYLIFRDFSPPNFTEKWPEHRAHKIEIPIDHIKQHLERSQKYTLKFNYTLEKPETPPIYLPPIRLTDESTKRTDFLHTGSDEVLNLAIPFQIYIGRPQVDDVGKVEPDEVIRWWTEANKDRKKSKDKFLESEQIKVIKTQTPPSVSSLTSILTKLAINCGGYLLIYVTGTNISDEKKLKETCIEIKKNILLAAFDSKPMVPVFTPYIQKYEKKPLFVVPVPMVPPRWYEDRVAEDDTFRNYLWVNSRKEQIIKVVNVTADNNKHAASELAETLAIFANGDGGDIFLDSHQNKNWQELYNIIWEARWKCDPPISRELLNTTKDFNEGGVEIRVTRPSSEVHVFEKSVFLWEQNSFKRINLTWDDLSEDDVDEVYNFIKDRCKLDLPTIEERPVISYAYLKGPNFDTREHYGAQYDPQRKVLRWDKEIIFVHNPDKRMHQTNLMVAVNRPIELYLQPDLEGEVTIDLNQKLVSGLDIAYFNALGEHVSSGGNTTIEKKSKIKLVFDHITLQSIFQHQTFRASRELEFEGIRPDFRRVNDIQGMLADLGLDNIRSDLVWHPQGLGLPLETISVKQVMEEFGGYEIRAWRPDGLSLRIIVKGELANVNRERQEGNRIDRTRIESGRMHIGITGSIQGNLEKAQELSDLLNHFQRLLKERFSNVRVQVA